MKEPPPQPRRDRAGRLLTTAHPGLYRAMRGFLKDLERAELEYRDEIAAQRKNLGLDARYTETPDVERYSLAIQLFASSTVEAVISLYAVLKFGGEAHDDHFRWGPADKRLQRAFQHAGIRVDDDAEILMLVRTITSARHTIAHPFSAEHSGGQMGSTRTPARAMAG